MLRMRCRMHLFMRTCVAAVGHAQRRTRRKRKSVASLRPTFAPWLAYVTLPRSLGRGASTSLTMAVHVELHALPALSIAEHRTRALQYASTRNVAGVLVGHVLGGTRYQVVDSLAAPLCDDGQVHAEALRQAWDLHQQVWPGRQVVGWYALGTEPAPHHAHMHATFLRCLSPDMPLTLVLFGEAEWHAFSHNGTWSPATLSLPSSATELIVLNDAHQRARFTDDAPSDALHTHHILASMQSERRALQMLCDRLTVACDYVDGVRQGTKPHDPAILRDLATAVVNRRPAPQTHDETDALRSTYLATLLNNLHTLHEVRPCYSPRSPRSMRLPRPRPQRPPPLEAPAWSQTVCHSATIPKKATWDARSLRATITTVAAVGYDRRTGSRYPRAG